VRPYRADDRERVRHICHVTGFIGEPADWYWRDAPSFADVFSGYYTDAEPQSALVAVDGGEVVGYLLGCVDSRRSWPPERVIARVMLRRALLVRPGTAGFFWRSIADVARDARRHRLPIGHVDLHRWPAHLHINLLPSARGSGVGSTLMRQWLDRLRDRGVRGCHLETMAENAGGLAFFSATGFTPEGSPQLVPGMRTRSGSRMHIQLMTQDL
jgi:ribosomal protein S18 acetylase RimI-like enzyme